ncbi:MAG TPA: ATP synthase F1 subunit gamma [Phycisphaerae bacterium]|nr:ATP synthase F1 subunit gamma [Phycisphaerae bacterium]HPS52615.1 ATP synthase F1 subunit gamma [Phycisphaerae bacterium]
MAKARKILARTKAIKNIHTVIRTMEMVSTARFKKAFNRTSSARPYIEGMASLVEDILMRCNPEKIYHPLFRRPEKLRNANVILITSDRGLCGGYNSALCKMAEGRLREFTDGDVTTKLYVVGKKGLTHMHRDRFEVMHDYIGLDPESQGWQWASSLGDEFMSQFIAGQLDCVEVVYSRLVGMGGHQPTCRALLPLAFQLDEDKDVKKLTMSQRVEYEFIPSAGDMLDHLLPMTVRLELYQWLMEAAVTEQIARMAAMRSANENATEMIRKLTVQYNRTRQAQITTELAEILGGAVALEG